MSVLVDIWSSEKESVEEKSSDGSSYKDKYEVGSGPAVGDESSPTRQGNLIGGGSVKLSSFLHEIRVSVKSLPLSEGSVSMLVDWFSA